MARLQITIVVLLLVAIGWADRPAFGQEGREAYILLIDTSISMQETPKGWNASKIAEVKRQLADFCLAMPRETQVMIYTFDRKPPRPGPQLVIRGDEEKATLRKFFADLNAPGKETHAWSSLEVVLGEARNLIKAKPQTTIRLLMYTDGEDNERPQRDLNAILKQFDDVLKDQVRMSYVTLGFTLGEDFRKTLEAHNIKTVPVADKDELIPLDAAFGWAPTRVTSEVEVQFFDKTNAMVESYQWTFGDEGTSTEQTPKHRYTKPGRYTVRLIVKGATGKTSTTERTVEVLPPEPITAAGRFAPPQVNLGEPVYFINESKGGVSAFEWNFGDGTKAKDEHPSHVYQKPGEYRVQLTVTRGDAKKTVMLDKAVVVKGPPAPTARIFAPQRGLIGEELRFVDASSGPIVQQNWDFGDGSAPKPGGEPTHSYSAPGRYTVKLTVAGPGGTNTATQVVEVIAPPKPEPEFIVGSTDIRVDQVVVLADLTKQPVDRATWDFGDGSPPRLVDYKVAAVEATRAVQHTFRKAGRYEVTLSVTGPGGTGSTKQSLEIRGHEPPVAKIVEGAEAHAGEPVVFNDASTGVVTRATWRFGDSSEPLIVEYGNGLDPAKRTVRHTFKQSGSYDVALDVEGPGGKSSDRIASLMVKPSERIPKALFELDRRVGRGELTVRFTNRSSGPIARYIWDFGDGSEKIVQDTKQDVAHTYGPGEFTPTLTAEGTDGLAPDTYRAEASVVVKEPWPAWVKHLLWIVPLIIVGIVAIGFGAREKRWRDHLRQLETLTGSLFYRPAGDATAPLETVDASNIDGDTSAWAFHINESTDLGEAVQYAGEFRKAVTVIQRPGTEITYTLELKRDGSLIGSATFGDGERAKIGPFAFEYRES